MSGSTHSDSSAENQPRLPERASTSWDAEGDRRDRAAAERDEKADRADQLAEENDRRAELIDAAANTAPISPILWRMRSAGTRRDAAEARARAARDRAAARADRDAAAQDRRQAAIDHLTGAYRRGAGMVELGHDFEHARRTGESMVIGFLDVDGLKIANDRHGHATGDNILRSVAAAIRTHLRNRDILVRYGGDEFVFSVLGLGEDAVRERLSRIQSMLETDGTGSITCGIAIVDDASSLAAVIEAADADLYSRRRAARSGTNDDGDRSALPEPRTTTSLHVADNYDIRSAHDGFAVRSTVIDGAIDAVLAEPDSVRTVYQPIVDLSDGSVVGYEALARWPQHPTLDPAAVFAAAAERGALTEVDAVCRTAALEGANATCGTVFLNIEPDAVRGAPDGSSNFFAAAAERFDIVLELTERSLLSDPAGLLRLVDRARGDGCRIAIDDIGCHPNSLALLDFIAPDIVKLDRVLIQHDPNLDRSRTIAAVTAYAESTGAIILAEGIETAAHLERARAYGAVLGQGWMFGRPAPLPDSAGAAPSGRLGTRRSSTESPTPFSGRVPALPSDVFDYALPSIGRKPLVAALTRHIEQQAQETSESLTILSTFQEARFFTPAIAERYSELAAANTFVAALGVGMTAEPAAGVRGTSLRPDEPFTRQWVIAVVGQHYFGAVIARDLGDTGDDDERRFEFLHTYDRKIVVAAARSLMERVIPR